MTPRIGEEHAMQQLAETSGVLIAASALVLVFGCATEGPTEKAGRQIDKAVRKTTEAIEAITEGVEQAGETTQTTLDNTGALVEDSAEAISETARTTLEKAKQVGTTIQKATEQTAEDIKEAAE